MPVLSLESNGETELPKSAAPIQARTKRRTRTRTKRAHGPYLLFVENPTTALFHARTYCCSHELDLEW